MLNLNIKKNSSLMQNEDTHLGTLYIIASVVMMACYWFNATLVYDDIAFPSNFASLVEQAGWFKTLIKIFCLDLPNEYRTYGVSRVIQFILWSVGVDSAGAYALLISISQSVTGWVLFSIIRKLNYSNAAAFSSGIIWIFSPFIWTSCFHHFSYLIFPVQVSLIGIYLMCWVIDKKKNILAAAIFGVIVGLTGEMHLAPVILFTLLFMQFGGGLLNRKVAFVFILTLIVSVVLHYLVWKTFAANTDETQRFNISVSHNSEYWIYRIGVAFKSIYLFVLSQVGELLGGGRKDIVFFLIILVGGWWLVLSRCASKEVPLATQSDHDANRSWLSLSLFIFILVYLAFYVFVVVITDSVPITLPRRYGYVPLTMAFVLACLTIDLIDFNSIVKRFLLSVVVGFVLILFGKLHFSLVPEVRSSDNFIAKQIVAEIIKSPQKPVLFFTASENNFPLTSIDAYTLGPAMRDVASSELTQAKFGTYWPSYINITKVLGAPYTCELGGWDKLGKLKLICPAWQANPGSIDPNEVIIVANIGFDSRDPLGRNVRVFGEFKDFESYYFSKSIVKKIGKNSIYHGESVAIDLGEGDSNRLNSATFPDKRFEIPINYRNFAWLKNYGWIEGDDSISKNNEISINSDYYRTNRYGNFIYKIEFEKSDVEIDLDFWELWHNSTKQRNFNISIAWDGGSWVSLGDFDLFEINKDSPFSVHLVKQNSTSIKIKLTSNPGSKDVPFAQGIRIKKRNL
jgi:hypothetical protein